MDSESAGAECVIMECREGDERKGASVYAVSADFESLTQNAEVGERRGSAGTA